MRFTEILESKAFVARGRGGVIGVLDMDAAPDGMGAAVNNTPRVLLKQSPSALFTVVYINDFDVFTQDQDKRTYEERYGRGSLRSRPADMLAQNMMGAKDLQVYEKVPGLKVIKKADHGMVRSILLDWFPEMDIDGFMGQFKDSGEKRVKRVKSTLEYKGSVIEYDNESAGYLDMVKGMLDTLHKLFDSHGVGFLLEGPIAVTTDKRYTFFGKYDKGTVYLNPKYADRPGAYITLIHEFGHKLHDLIGFDNSEIKDKFDEAKKEAEQNKAKRGGGKWFSLNIVDDRGIVVYSDGEEKIRGTVSQDGDKIVFKPLNGDPAVRFSQWTVSERHSKRLRNLDGSNVIVPHSEWLYTLYSYEDAEEMFTELFTRYILKYDRSSEPMQWMKKMISLAKK